MKEKEYHVAILQLLFPKLLYFPSPPPQKKWMNLISNWLSNASIKYLNRPSLVFRRFRNGCNKVVIEPRVMQFRSELIFGISAQTALHSVQLPL